MLVAGLTGGIASGKTLVAEVFKKLGADVIDADLLVHRLQEPDQQAWREIVDHFGKGILLPDRRINRRKLGDIVFPDAEKRAWLNACLHPKVFASFTSEVENIRKKKPHAIVIFDAVLLIETGYYKNMDKTIVVYAEQEQQIERVIGRDALSREQALARIRSQMPLSEKCRFAQYVIKNTGTREHAEEQATEIFLKLREDEERMAK